MSLVLTARCAAFGGQRYAKHPKNDTSIPRIVVFCHGKVLADFIRIQNFLRSPRVPFTNLNSLQPQHG